MKMKNVSSLKSIKDESPKTPGGISKSLLTPCRRIGLSRIRRNVGPSPFISPLSASSSNNVEVKKETRKRKERVSQDDIKEEEEERRTPVESDGIANENNYAISVSPSKKEEIIGTPTRHIQLPRKKKSKTLISTIKSCKENTTESQEKIVLPDKQSIEEVARNKKDIVDDQQVVKLSPPEVSKVATLVRGNSNSKSYISAMNCEPKNAESKCDTNTTDFELKENKSISTISTPVMRKYQEKNKTLGDTTSKPISPNDLTKECIVVLQKKIFKTYNKTEDSIDKNMTNADTKTSQIIFDSDIDDVPLSHLNKKENVPETNVILIDDDDFTETTKVKVKKLEDKNTSTGGLKTCTKKKNSHQKPKNNKTQIHIESQSSSQSSNSYDDDDDFDFENKKTILIRKTYDKITKPLKAKSTGSITQKDIDELKSRIEMKKKLLLAKTVTNEDTEELRGLIKKWQRGCQDALMELMELMKVKFPDKQNMDYSEMLQTLRIPACLVGYDSDNDCFNTPDDASVILSKFNNC